MENSMESLFDLKIDDQASNELNATGKWAKRIAIVSLAVIIVCILFFLFMGVAFSSLNSYLPYEIRNAFDFDSSGIVIIIAIVIAMILGGLYIFLLYKFGNNLIKATNYQDQDALETAFDAYKTYLIISGVLGILGLFFSLIGLLN